MMLIIDFLISKHIFFEHQLKNNITNEILLGNKGFFSIKLDN